MIFENNYLLSIYYKYPFHVKKAKGMYIYTNTGKYLDMFSGLATNSLGHRNKKIIRSIKRQLNKYLHLSNFFINEKANELAKILVDFSFPSKVFFTNSGTEANEFALKIAKLYGKVTGKKKILALENSFHGRTFGSMAITGKNSFKKFGPFFTDVTFLKINDLENLKKNVNEDTLCIFLELIQGESGIHVINQEYVDLLCELREKYKFLLIIDEVQTGLMRTGLMYAFMHYKIVPDIVTLAKSLGGGLPLGAVIIHQDYVSLINHGDHGSTFAPNPLAIAAGLALVKEITKFKYYHNINLIGDYLKFRLNKFQKDYPNIIKEVRGTGLMLGVEIIRDIDIIKKELFKAKILINVTNNNVIRLLPAFIIKKKQIDYFLMQFEEVLKKIAVEV